MRFIFLWFGVSATAYGWSRNMVQIVKKNEQWITWIEGWKHRTGYTHNIETRKGLLRIHTSVGPALTDE